MRVRLKLAWIAAAAMLVIVALASSDAHAETAKLAGIAATAPGDARKAVAIGPSGELYEPNGKGEWVRTRAGGTADELVAFTSGPGGAIIADTKGPALFKLRPNGWTSIRLAQKAKTILGAGTRAIAAAGKSVFALDKGSQPTKLADAPLPVLAVAGGPAGVIISTAKGFLALQGSGFKPIKNAPRTGGTLVSDRYVLVSTGVFDLKTLKTTPWPAGTRVGETSIIAGTDTLLAVGRRGKTAELYTVKVSGKLEREEVPLPDASPVVGVVGDKAGRVVIATRDGHLAVRTPAASAKAAATWDTVDVRDELPADKPGPPPAESP